MKGTIGIQIQFDGSIDEVNAVISKIRTQFPQTTKLQTIDVAPALPAPVEEPIEVAEVVEPVRKRGRPRKIQEEQPRRGRLIDRLFK